MPTKRELIERAHALGESLGVEVDVERKNHQALTELVEELEMRAQPPAEAEGGEGESEKPDDAGQTEGGATSPEPPANAPAPIVGGVRRAAGPGAPEAPPPTPDAPPAPPAAKETPPSAPKAAVYRVASGKVLTSLRGHLRAGEVVTVADLAVPAGDPTAGERTLDLLVSKGVIKKQ